MKKYTINIVRSIDLNFEVEASSEEEAFEKANEQFDSSEISGNELYNVDSTIIEEKEM